jgi:hypothetical protein
VDFLFLLVQPNLFIVLVAVGVLSRLALKVSSAWRSRRPKRSFSLSQWCVKTSGIIVDRNHPAIH